MAKLVCQICGEFKIVEGKRTDMVIRGDVFLQRAWIDFGAHMLMYHYGTQQVSVRVDYGYEEE